MELQDDARMVVDKVKNAVVRVVCCCGVSGGGGGGSGGGGGGGNGGGIGEWTILSG